MPNANNKELEILEPKWGQASYPKDHKFGMAVPDGGSNCAKCEYLKDPKKHVCGNFYFIKWNKGEIIPAKDMSKYCCDVFEAK